MGQLCGSTEGHENSDITELILSPPQTKNVYNYIVNRHYHHHPPARPNYLYIDENWVVCKVENREITNNENIE